MTKGNHGPDCETDPDPPADSDPPDPDPPLSWRAADAGTLGLRGS